jgi:hypothetical protein
MATSDPPFKRVFVLGAGFSRAAGFPLQREILDRIKGFKFDIMTVEFRKARKELLDFLNLAFGEPQEPSLEDIFTLLDQTIGRGEACANYSPSKLERVRTALKRAILFVFHQASTRVEPAAKDFYHRLAMFLIESRIAPGQERDTIGVVSLNWDCLLEDSLYNCIRELEAVGKIDIDYCCYTTPLRQPGPHTPSILQKARGIFNIKVMKLHGSTNWLVCPNCKRLYTGVGATEDVWELYVRPRQCESCIKLELIREMHGDESDADAPDAPLRLEPFFITPTFIKMFDNTHIQSAWHNAYVNLAEASEIVFIGYSLPDADYHVRTLLRRAIRPEAKIFVVLSRGDEPAKSTPARVRGMFAANRYRAFFSPDRISLDTRGVGPYFEDLLDHRSLPTLQASVSTLLMSAPQPATGIPPTPAPL